jgi:hypothetical protein
MGAAGNTIVSLFLLHVKRQFCLYITRGKLPLDRNRSGPYDGGMKPPKMIWRTNLDMVQNIPDVAGIYVIAADGHILYVGQSKVGCITRIYQHMNRWEMNKRQEAQDGGRPRSCEWLGQFLCEAGKDSWQDIRVDILEAPDNDWIRNAEAELIWRFRPKFNLQLTADFT